MPWDFKSWYAEHKAEFNERRKQRYREDSEYRKKIQKWNSDAHSAKREQQLTERRKLKKATRLKLHSPSPVVITIREGGKSVEKTVVPIGLVAKAVGRGVQSLRRYERLGIIPKTPYHSKNGTRLYTVEQVMEIQTILKDKGRVGKASVRQRGYRKPVRAKVRLSNGEEHELSLFRIGYLALALERTVQYITQLELKGLFPQTPLRLKGHRLYAPDMIEAARQVLDSLDGILRGGNLKRFASDIAERWMQDGYRKAQLVEVLDADAA